MRKPLLSLALSEEMVRLPSSWIHAAKRNSLNSLGLRNKGDSVHALDNLANSIYFYLIIDYSSIIKASLRMRARATAFSAS